MKEILKIILLQPEQDNSREILELVNSGARREFPNAIVKTINDLQYIYNDSPQLVVNAVTQADLVIANMDGTNASVTFGLDIAIDKSKPIILIEPAGSATSTPERLLNKVYIKFSLNSPEQFVKNLSQQIKIIVSENTKKSELLLDSLKIENYRGFKNLTIEKLGRVNLIVGKNNVGKTALLEGLWLYANAGYQSLMFEILRERDEIPPFQDGTILVQPESSRGLRNLFYGRPELGYTPIDAPENSNGDLRFRIGENIDISGPEPKQVTNTLWATAHRSTSNDPNNVPSVQNELKPYKQISNAFVKANGLTDKKLIEFWDSIEKLVREDLVIEALSLVTPELKDIRFSGYPNGSFSRVPVVRLEGARERIPLRSLGEGMTRVLGVASALINCENGMLLIDEIEGGLHYSVLLQLWRLIFKTAKDLNVQVFATTHSEDCVEAFAIAAEESPEEGMLIRLERQGEQIVAKIIEEKRLEIAMEHGVEVR